jgi:hypothetical protein
MAAFHCIVVRSGSKQIVLTQAQVHKQHCDIPQVSAPVFLPKINMRNAASETRHGNNVGLFPTPDQGCRG